LEPGAYTIVALAFKQPQSCLVMASHSGDPDFIGMTNVVVTPGRAPPLVKFELVPWETGRTRSVAPTAPGGENNRGM
jgi:hypothetical protein